MVMAAPVAAIHVFAPSLPSPANAGEGREGDVDARHKSLLRT